MTNLEQIQEFVDAQNATNSNTDKLNVLKKYAKNEAVRNALEYTYNTFKQYGVTSANCKKNSNLVKYGYSDLFKLLDDLSIRFITGHTAISLVNGFVEANKKHEDLIFSIIDRNLKTRSTTSMINKVIPGLIPTFDVALANSYDEKTAKKVDFNDTWFVSRKLDGCLHKDSIIEFEDGTKLTIKEVVDNRIKGKKYPSTIKRQRKAIMTPDGRFESLNDAGKHYKLHPTSIMYRVEKYPTEYYYM